jgi:DNA-binding IclR family transcriptional regulator
VPLTDEVVIIHHEPRPDGSRQMPEVGIVIPAHASALGKAMLAYLPAEADALLRRRSLRSMTGETLTDPAELHAQLADLRAGGVALECDEAVLGESSVAAAVFDATGLVVGAIAIVVPTNEWPVEDSALEAVRTTARTLSRELGAQQWPVSVT